MANQIISNGADGTGMILVHGRGSLVFPFKYYDRDENGDEVQIDLSGRTLRFEVDGVPLDVLLVADPDDAKGQLVKVRRTEVKDLKTMATQFSIIDETNAEDDIYNVLWNGKIARFGYSGEPDAVDG